MTEETPESLDPKVVTILPIPHTPSPRFFEKSPESGTYLGAFNGSRSSIATRISSSWDRKSFQSDTVAGSIFSKDDQPQASGSSLSTTIPTRTELNKVLGEDIVSASALEISSIPCAGVRISHGPLQTLMAWRLIVQLDEPTRNIGNAPRQAVVCNFILDTGSNRQPIPAEVLLALNYKGNTTPGKQVTLTIQGIKTTCVVGQPGEAARLTALFTTAGSLTFYYDARLSAPVLFMGDQEHYSIEARNIPRTVRRNLTQRVVSMVLGRP